MQPDHRTVRFLLVAGIFCVISHRAISGDNVQSATAPALEPGAPPSQRSGTPLSHRADIEARGEPLRKVLRRVAAEHKLRVRFDEPVISSDGKPLDKPVTVALRNFPFESALDRLLRPRGLQSSLSGDTLAITIRSSAPGARLSDRQGIVDYESSTGAQPSVSDTTFDAWIFGDTRNPVALRQRFDSLLSRKTELMGERCGLTGAQTKKLQLAGRGDIERFFERLARLKSDFAGVKNDNQKRNNFFTSQVSPLESALNGGPFGESSLLAKAIPTTLNPVQIARYAPQRLPGYENLARIGVALQAYHDCFGHFPGAVEYGPDGTTAYSWRVELLPMLRHCVDGRPGGYDLLSGRLSNDALRKAWWQSIEDEGYRLDESWDSVRNREWARRYRNDYRHPASVNCAYFVVNGKGTAFPPDRALSADAIGDKADSTLMVVEANRAIPWTMPNDLAIDAIKPLPKFGGLGNDVFLALTCDGAVHAIALETGENVLRAFMTANAGDFVDIPGVPWRPDAPTPP